MNRPRVLCVDDEPQVLEGLQRALRSGFEVSVATSGQAALARLAAGESFEVVVSDMRMPVMNGAALLSEFRHQAPDTVRLLLTGQSDLDAAIAAVNEGQIFRFLTKPCPPDRLATALRAATFQHRLLTGERVLLEQTLVGSVRALTEVMCLVHPEVFGAGARQHERARAIAERLGIADAWHVEVASMLTSAGYAVLPSEVLIKVNAGNALDETERAMVARVPGVVERMLSHIPRLENVREVLKHQRGQAEKAGVRKASNLGAPIGARILQAVQDLTVAEARLGDLERALTEVVARRDYYGSNVLDALVFVCRPEPQVLRSLMLREITMGMVIVDAVKTDTGVVLLPRGQRVTAELLERLNNVALRSKIVEPIRCEVPASA